MRYAYPGGVEVVAVSDGGMEVKGLVDKDGKAMAKTLRTKYVAKVVFDGSQIEVEKYTSRVVESPVLTGDGNGVLIVGEGGTIFVSRSLLLANEARLLTEPLKGDPGLYPSRPTNHFGNLLDCVKTREALIYDATGGGGSVVVCHLGVIALRTGKAYAWDAKANRLTGANADEGNKHLGRERRAPWKLDA